MSLADDILKKSVTGAKDTPASAQEGTSESASLLSLNSLSDKVPKAKKEDDTPAATPVSMPAADAPSSNLLANANKGNAALSLSSLVGNFERKAPEKPDHSGGFAVGTAVGFGQNIVGQVTGVVDIFIKKDDDSSTLISRATGQKTGNESALNNALKTAGQLGSAGLDLAGEGADNVLGTNWSSGKTSSAIGKAVDKVKSDWNTGDSYTRGQIVGNVLGFGVTAFAGGAGVAKTSRALTGNAAELRVIATGYKEANLAMESINVLRSGTGLADDAAKFAAVKTAPSLLGRTADAFLNPLKQATEGLGTGTRNLLGQGESALAHAPAGAVNPLMKGPMMTRVQLGTGARTDLASVARTVETNVGKGATHVRTPGANIIDDIKVHAPKDVVEPPAGLTLPKDGVSLPGKTGTGVVDNVAPGTGSVADDVLAQKTGTADILAGKGTATEQLVIKGADDVIQPNAAEVVRPQGTIDAIKPGTTSEIVKPGGPSVAVKPAGTADDLTVKPTGAADDVRLKPTGAADDVTLKPTGAADDVTLKPTGVVDDVRLKPTGAADDVTLKPTGAADDLTVKPTGAADDAIKGGTNNRPAEVPAGTQKVEAVQPKLEVPQSRVELPGQAVSVERAPLTAVEATTQQVIASGTKFGDNVAQIATTASGTAISSNLDEIVRLTRTLGQGADDLTLSQIKKNIDDIARSGSDDIANQLRRGLDDVERHSAISTTARTLQTTSETLGTQATGFSDEAAKLANRTRTTSPIVSEKLEDVSRLSRELASPTVVDQAAVIRQMRTTLDDIARNGGDEVSRKLSGSLDDIERASSSVKNLRLTQQVQESALTVNKQIATITDDLATKVTGKAAPAIKEELSALSKATDDLVKGTDTAAAVRVQESLAKLERMTVGTNVADDVSRLASHTSKLESTVAVSHTAKALEATTQTVAKQATQLADNAIAPSLRTQAEKIAGTTGSRVITEQLDEISRLARTVGNSADDAAVLTQIRQSVNTIARSGGDDIAKQLKGGIDDLERSVTNSSTLRVTQKVEESAMALRTQVANLGDNIVEKVPGATGPAVREELKVLSKATDDLIAGDATAAARVKESLTKIEGATRNTAASDDVARLANQTSKLEGTVAVSRTTRALETTTQTLGTQGTQLSDDIARMAQTAKTTGSAPVVVAEKLDDMSKLAAKIGTTGDDLAIVSQLRRGIDDIARSGGDDIAKQLRTSVDEIERTAGAANKLKLTQRVEETALNLRTQVSNLSDNAASTPGLDAAASQAFRQELKTFTTATDDMLRGVDNTATARVAQSLKNIEQMTAGTRFADDVARVSDDAAKLQSTVNISRTARTLETTTEAMVGQATRLSDDATRFATTNANTVGKAVTDKLDEVSQLSRTIGKSGDDLATLRTIRNHLDDVSRSGGDDIARQLRTSVDELERSARQAQTLKLTQKVEETALSVRTQVGNLSDDLLKAPSATGSVALRQELRNFANAADDLVRGADDAAALRLRTSIDNIEQLTAANPTLKIGTNVTRISDNALELQNAVNASRTFGKLETVTQAIAKQSTALGDDAARLAQTAGNNVIGSKLDEISRLSRTVGRTGDDIAVVRQIKSGLDDIARSGGDDVARQLRTSVDELERSTLSANRLSQTQKVQEFATSLRTQLTNVTDNAVNSTTAAALRQELKTVSRATDDLVRGVDDAAAIKTINNSTHNLQQLSVGTRFSDDVARLVNDTRTLNTTVTASRTAQELTVAAERLVTSGTRLADDAARFATTNSGTAVAGKLDEIANLSKTLGRTGDDLKAVAQIKNSVDDIARAGGDDIARQMRPAVAEIENAALQASRLREAQRLALTVGDDAGRIARTAKELSESVVGTTTEARLLRQHLNTIARTADELPAAANQGAQVSKIKTAIESVKNHKGAQFVDDLERSIAALDANVVKSSTNKVFAEQGRRIEGLVTNLQDDLARANQGLRPLVMPERTLMSDLAKIEVQTGKLAQTLKQGGAANADNAAASVEHITAIRQTINEIAANGHNTVAQNLARTINGIDEALKIQKFEQLAANSDVLAATLKQQVADIPATSANQAVRQLQQTVAELPASSSPQLVLSTLKDGVKAIEGTTGGATIAQQLSPTITRLETTVAQQRTLANELVASTASTIESQIRGIQTAGRLSGQQQAIAAASENVQFVRHLTAQTDPRMALQAELTQQHLTKLEMASRAASNAEVARAGGNKVLAMAEMGHEAASSRVLLQGLTPEGAKFRSMVTNSSMLSRVNDLVKSGGLLVGLVKDRQVLGAVLKDAQGARAGMRYAASAAGLIGTGGYLGYNAYYHSNILPRKILDEQAENEKQRLEGIGSSEEQVERASLTDAPVQAQVERRQVDMEFSPSVAEALKASQRSSVIPRDGIAARHGISPDDPDARVKEESLRRTSRIYSWSGKGGFAAPSADVERINVQTAKSLRIRSATGGATGDSGIRLPKTAVAEYEFSYTKAMMGLNNQNKLLASASNDGRKQAGLGGSRYGGTSASTPMSSNLRTMIAHNAFRSEGIAHGNQVLNGAEATEATGLDQSKSGAGSIPSGPQLTMNQDGTFSVVAQAPAQDPNGAQPQVLATAASNTNLVDQLAQRYAAESEATA